MVNIADILLYTPYPENTAEFTFLKPNGQVGLKKNPIIGTPRFNSI